MEIHQAISNIQQKQAEKSRVEDQIATVHSIDGLFMITGSGEASVFVNFPVKFIERPNLSFGFELDPSAVVAAGSYPSVSAVIGGWAKEGPSNKRTFTGATILVVSTGPVTQKIWVHWTASAKATTNPFM